MALIFLTSALTFLSVVKGISYDENSATGDSCTMGDLLQNTYIGKNTLASSDSYRDNANTLLIFPEAEAQFAPAFHQDKCARQSKLELPYSCFAIHSPQTWQHEEGYLSVKTLENEFSKKFHAVINKVSSFSYDAFMDYNVGFWVNNLDTYLKQLNDYNDILTDYIGLKWHSPKPIDKIFYSLIIHSPDSQITFELMSFVKPNLSLFFNIRSNFEFTEINEIRSTFLTYQKDDYPWNRSDGATIIPVKISFACSNINQHIEFYVNVMEAKLLYAQHNVVSDMDGVFISYAFLQSISDVLEIEFVERPIDYTFGKFTVETYQTLLTDTHNDRVTSPTCGLDRWFDNHYGFNTLKLGADHAEHYDYMDRVLNRLIERKLKYRLYLTPYQYESPAGKYWMDKYGKDGMYTLYVFDINGQVIQMLGIFWHYKFYFDVPMYNKQWCYVPCGNNQQQGLFDPTKIYHEKEDEIFVVSQKHMFMGKYESNHFVVYIVVIIAIKFIVIGTYKCRMRKDIGNTDNVCQLDERHYLLATHPRYYI